ncbi:MAG: Choline-sulfatase, partial [Verrucomicrobiota bacterium]
MVTIRQRHHDPDNPMKTYLIILAAALSCFTQGLIAASPNFVFILADDQSWNGTSVPMMPGNDFSKSRTFRTPNLEQLASQGMIFSQAYAAHPKCECSRAAILMGRSTTTLNATEKNSRNWSAPAGDSLANTLKRANPAYRAAHLGKWQWSQTPESMGYDVNDGITMNEDGDSQDPNDPKLSFSITRRAAEFMGRQVKEGHPFYLQLSYYAVHQQPQALASTLKKYEGMGGGGGGRGDRAVMAAMTEDLDTCVGEIMKQLQKLGIADNTYLVYMSDNGGRTEILKGGKGNLGEGGLRVPLIVRGPGIKGGSYCNEPVVSYDLLPTVLDFATPG